MSRLASFVADDVLSRARKLRGLGRAWERLAADVGVSEHIIRSRLDPGYAEKVRARVLFSRKHVRTTDAHIADTNLIPPEEAARAIASVPPDTRNRTARLCGDPLPGRSALDRRSDSDSAKVIPTINTYSHYANKSGA